jgi:hypothetical protein
VILRQEFDHRFIRAAYSPITSKLRLAILRAVSIGPCHVFCNWYLELALLRFPLHHITLILLQQFCILVIQHLDLLLQLKHLKLSNFCIHQHYCPNDPTTKQPWSPGLPSKIDDSLAPTQVNEFLCPYPF